MKSGALLDAVEQGVFVTVTRKGKPVARRVPIGEPRFCQAEAIEMRKTFADGVGLNGHDLGALRDEGRP
jgi:antitoxin (DNA-binding transcriptional repressor) of toxin-antitoxin stability system